MTGETSPGQSTPLVKNTVSWRHKFEEKETELTIANVKIASLEQKVRERDTELDVKNELVEKYINPNLSI